MELFQTSALRYDYNCFPTTRYLGSKRRIARWILEQLANLDYQTVLDAFGGTASMAYAFKCAEKTVTYNDVLTFNFNIGYALIENTNIRLTPNDINHVLQLNEQEYYPDFIERNFRDVYFTNEENHWLDAVLTLIRALDCHTKRALCYYALCQSAIAKRPYNLFHRKNLYMRFAEVQRSFGNKTTWDRNFEDHFRQYAREANCAVFDNGSQCRAVCQDALHLEPGYDLVYIDTPYINRNGIGVDYRDFYHFLEGIVDYEHWHEMVDYDSRHRRLKRIPDPWSSPTGVMDMFSNLFTHYNKSILVVSYRSNGIPSIPELETTLRSVKNNVRTIYYEPRSYALSTNRKTQEVLLIGSD